MSVSVKLRPPPNALPVPVSRYTEDDAEIIGYFAAALQAERVRAGMAPEDLAARVRQKRSTVVAWESARGIPRVTNLLRLLGIFPNLIEVLRDLSAQLAEQQDDVVEGDGQSNGTAA